MKDNEIIKALVCCKGIPMCDRCPYLKKCGRLSGDALDLIYRQQSKIKALQMDNAQLQSDIITANCNLDHVTMLFKEEVSKNEKLKGIIIKQYREKRRMHHAMQSCEQEANGGGD